MIIAIDPGNKTGVALFKEEMLFACGLIDAKNLRNLYIVLKNICEEHPLIWRGIIEKPRIYDRLRWKGDPNDLLNVAIQAGVCIGVLSEWCDVDLVFPQQWKGQRPKDIDNQYTLSLLEPRETEVLKKEKIPKSYRHNVIDAIGLGLYALNRK